MAIIAVFSQRNASDVRSQVTHNATDTSSMKQSMTFVQLQLVVLPQIIGAIDCVHVQLGPPLKQLTDGNGQL